MKTELMTILRMAIPEIIAGGSPHSPITALTNNNKNIEFKIMTANFIQRLLNVEIV